MAQAVMSTLLLRPNVARARPSSLIKNDDDYGKIFSPKISLGIYKVCAEILQKVERVIKSEHADLEQAYRNNLKFHLVMYVVLSTLKASEKQTVDNIENINLNSIDDQFILGCLKEVKSIFEKHGATDQVAKTQEFTESLLEELSQKFPKKAKENV